MADKKIYSIQINGIQESVNAVEALNAQLKTLEARIKALENSSVKVNAGGSSSSNASSASEEAAVQREINKLKAEGANLDAKIAAAQDEVYKRVDATKQLYKETIADQKAMAAQERLTADAYSNTMQGMKSQLADLKAVINTTDLGDGDSIKKMAQQANELTNKLKEMEQSYGQFGRNVGNYANGVADGLSKIKINVGDTVREFGSAREASRTLNEELKAMAINGETDTKAFKDLRQTVMELESTMKDVKSPMDNIMDGFQSLTAIAATTQGISALFGLDDSEIERSIQKLVALQNVMQGIDTINKQMQTKEGIGGWIAKGNAMIDSFVEKLLGASKAQKGLNTTMTAGKTASEGLAAAETAQATATAGATVATKALSFALKTLGIGLVVTAVAYLVENWEDLYDWLTDTIPALKNLSTWFDKIKAVAMGVGSAIANYMIQPLGTLIKVIQAIINGNFSEIPNIISEGFKKTFDLARNYQKGYNKETENQQKKHNQKMLKEQKKANDEWLKDEEAKYGQSYERTKQYLNKQMELINKELANTKKGSKEYDALIQQQKEVQRKIWENERTEKEKNQKKSEALSKKYAKEDAEIEKEMYQLRINAMKEGLNKTITQLEEERKQRLAKLRENGRNYKEEEAEVNRVYDLKILEAKQEWAQKVEKVYQDLWDRIKDYTNNNTRDITKMMENSIEMQNQGVKENADEFFKQGIGSYGVQGKNLLSPTTQLSLGIQSENQSEFMTEMKKYIDMIRELKTVENEWNAATHEFNNEFNKLSDEQIGILNMNLDKYENYYKKLKKEVDDYREYLKEKYGEENFMKANNALIEENYSSSLSKLFKQRISAVEAYWALRKKVEATNANDLLQQKLKDENVAYEREKDANFKNFTELTKLQDEYYEKKNEEIGVKLKKGRITEEEALKQRQELEDEYWKIEEKMQTEYFRKDTVLRIQHETNVRRLEQEKNANLKKINSEYYQSILQELRDFQTAQSNLESRNNRVTTALGLINIKKTKENYQRLLDNYQTMADAISVKRKKLNEDFQKGLIDKDTYDASIRELDNFTENIGTAMERLKKLLEDAKDDIWTNIALITEFVGSIIQNALSSIATIMDNHYQEEIDKQDEYIKEYEDKLDKQREITEKYANNIESIEDELATSRGDRRQHLIDQLNAEIAAQREAQAEEKRIEMQKQREEEKKKKLQNQQAKKQKQMDLYQATISTAVAVTNGLATKPFIPLGLAMGALAASLGALQIAAIATKPVPQYGDGGVIQGRLHSQGGVKVLGGRAEVEGGEFITNRQTTASNIDLLEYINAKHRKLDINDFISFYSSGAKKSVISMSPRTKFADGGQIPTLNNEYQFDDRLLTAFEDYSNRPVYVSVVDINKKQNDVKNIQVLAGLNE